MQRNVNTHYMKLQNKPFELIRCGKKIYELRLYDDKRRSIAEGDNIVFENMQSGEIINTVVEALFVFSSFDELYKGLPLEECGYDKEGLETASPKDMEEYYSVEEQMKHNVVGIKIKHKV